jgi:hypothetical protein
MRFGFAPHSGTFFWMRELRSSGQAKVQRMLNRGQLAGQAQRSQCARTVTHMDSGRVRSTSISAKTNFAVGQNVSNSYFPRHWLYDTLLPAGNVIFIRNCLNFILQFSSGYFSQSFRYFFVTK